MDNIISNKEDIPKWMALGKTALCQKDPSRGSAIDNYRPISCLPLIWKLISGTIAESIYNFFNINDKLPESNKKYVEKKRRGSKIQLLIDETIPRDCRKRHRNLGMTWVDYKKAYTFPHPWILQSLEFAQVCDKIFEFVKKINDKLANRVNLMLRKFGES